MVAIKKLRVIAGFGPLSLRKSPDQSSPLYEAWHVWQDREEFTPPPHMRVDKALERGIVEEVKDG